MSRIYYVSTKSGNDQNDGSLTCPFLTLSAAANRNLEPGDQILLERGSVFSGQYLHLTVSGTAEEPITIGAYGEGELPRIEADGNGIWYQNYGTQL
ncbi:MAG: polyhydroxyalkanoate depolymerase, partial [Oliverpabstia sp.]